jgi:hypothetical protein
VNKDEIISEIESLSEEFDNEFYRIIRKIVINYIPLIVIVLGLVMSLSIYSLNDPTLYYPYTPLGIFSFWAGLALFYRLFGNWIVDGWINMKKRFIPEDPKTTIAKMTIENYENWDDDGGIRDIVELPESEVLEFKSSVWAQYNNNSGELIDKQTSKSLTLEDSIIKTIAAFLNTQGGKLIIGVQDRPKRKVVGIEADYQWSGQSKDIESFQNSLTNAIKTATNDPAIIGSYVDISIDIIEGKSICMIDVKQKAPKSWTYVTMKNWKNKGEKKECFFVRSGPSSNIIESRQSADEWKLARKEMQEY